ncbi:MAG: hypothetical protein WDN67_00965 [Candidatus Moraniibacteriota bacterium]
MEAIQNLCPKSIRRCTSKARPATRFSAGTSPEHEAFELGPRSRVIVTVVLIAVIAYALITNSPLMAITFILVGVVGYLLQHQEPEVLSYSLTSRGIVAGRDFYRYETIESFQYLSRAPVRKCLEP